jgi:serine/threonine protein kinase
MIDVLQGAAHMHSKGFVHRDIKPQNVLLQWHDGHYIAKLGDFGLAKCFYDAGLSGLTMTGDIRGSFPFMPAEQITDHKYERPNSDVWSLAAVFFQLLTGEFPRAETNLAPLQEVLDTPARPIQQVHDSIPIGIAQVIDRALLSERSARFQDANEMLVALQQELKISANWC